LRNVYSVLQLNPARLDPGRAESAQRFEAFLLDPEIQQLISEFGRERFGRSLFRPLHKQTFAVSPTSSSETGAALKFPPLSLLIEITARTLKVCSLALVISLLLGLPIGIAVGRRKFIGRGALVSLINSGMGAPPVVVGLVVVLTLSRNGPLGGLDWELQVRTLGVPRYWGLWLLVREIRLGLLAAVIVALGGILSEVGAVSMVGGNLEGETRVLTSAILMYTQMGEYETALGLGAMLLGLFLALAGALTVVQQSGRT
jgi:tungstate transport system permease protein